MNRPRHLLVSLSPHGYGHAAMTAPVVNGLRQLLPELRITLQTSTSPDFLRTRYEGPFDLVDETFDFGLMMVSAMEVDVEASAARYRALHNELDHAVDAEAQRMIALGVDLLLANIPYLPLLAARRAGIPAVALSCLNWADLYGAFLAGREGAAIIETTIRRAYASAQVFLKPEPAMPMPGLSNVRSIGPIARRGRERREELRHQLAVTPETKVGLIAFGGMDPGLSLATWPEQPGWIWISTLPGPKRSDIVAFADVAFGFSDLMRSVDVLVGKPGYGTFAEAAVNGTPVLALERPNWPETPYLTEWLERFGRCKVVSSEDIRDRGLLKEQLQSLFSLQIKPLVDPTGIDQSVRAVQGVLGTL